MNANAQERLVALLADSTGMAQLSSAETAELESLLPLYAEIDVESFEEAAAAIHLALVRPTMEELPRQVRKQVLAQAREYFKSETRRTRVPAWTGWLMAALITVLFWLNTPGERSKANAVQSAADTLIVSWTPTEDPDAQGVTGALLWSDSEQAGLMRFNGLPPNDPQQMQYQLWIFSAGQPTQYPVDGGVFDSLGGEIQIPIDAKIAVSSPGLFAITCEKPGGVVVSTRERLLLTATPE
jgi:hypothetical protein